MRTRTYVKYAKNLTPAEYTQCYKKNLGKSGNMRGAIAMAWQDKTSTSRCILIKDVDSGNIIAWALSDAKHMGNTGVMFWVEKSYRQKGYGTRLLKHTQKKVDPQPRVFPHDQASGRFFKKHLKGVKVERYDRYWLNGV